MLSCIERVHVRSVVPMLDPVVCLVPTSIGIIATRPIKRAEVKDAETIGERVRIQVLPVSVHPVDTAYNQNLAVADDLTPVVDSWGGLDGLWGLEPLKTGDCEDVRIVE